MAEAGIPGRRLRRRAAALVLAAGLLAAGAGAAEPAAVVEATNELTYAPQQVRIEAGETVEWRNASVLVHTVTADPDRAARAGNVALPKGAEPFHSGSLEPGASFRHTFETPGTWRYFCVPHEAAGMTGLVVVEPRGAAPGGSPR